MLDFLCIFAPKLEDLTNSNVTSLDQIKWIFNGAKNPPNFSQNMLDAIDNLPLTNQMAQKFLPNVTNPSIT